jgi:hypothetical protein
MFWRKIVPPSSRLKNKPSKLQAGQSALVNALCLLGIFFDPEDGSRMLLPSV